MRSKILEFDWKNSTAIQYYGSIIGWFWIMAGLNYLIGEVIVPKTFREGMTLLGALVVSAVGVVIVYVILGIRIYFIDSPHLKRRGKKK